MALSGCGGCGDEPHTAPPRRALPEVPEPEVEEPEEYLPLYDEEGRLLPSDESLVGIQLPRGLTLIHQYGRQHTYRSEAPAEKLLEYLGARVFTADVRPRNRGAVYKYAVPMDNQGAEVRFDVSVTTRRQHTRLRILEHPVRSREEIPEAERVRRFNEQLRDLD